MNIKIDNEFRDIISPLQSEEYEQLKQNIILEGVREPLIVWQGIIIDGHHRYKIATENNIPFETIEKQFEDRNAVKEWMIKNQFGRRNISKYDRTCLAILLKDIIAQRAKENQLRTSENRVSQKSVEQKIDTQKELARIANVSHDTISKVEKIQAKADDETKAKLKSGDISINKAFTEIKKNEQLESRKQHILENNKKTISIKPKIYNEDCISWLNKQKDCDLLITDPPYSTDIKDIKEFAKSWLPLALSKVKNTGFAFVCIGAYPEEVKAYLDIKTPSQILIWEYKNTLGNNPKDRYKQNYQMILFYRMAKSPDLKIDLTSEQWAVQSINAPDGRLGDRHHTWQKPIELSDRLVKHTNIENGILLDPFCCTGTFLLSGSKYNMNSFGCDISKNNLNIAIERGCIYGK